MPESGVEALFAHAVLDPALPVPHGITTARGEPDLLRLSVYRNNVHVGLVEALARTFPVTGRIVGTDFFRAMARVYAGLHKPKSAVMFRYGEDFADFIGNFPPAAVLPYLPDVARLEFAWTEAYHARDEAWLKPRDLAGTDPLRLADARIVPHPAARLISSRFAIGTIWQANSTGTATRVPAGQSETVLLTRPDAEVRVTVVPETDATFIGQLLECLSIAEATERSMALEPTLVPGRVLHGLLACGAIADIVTLQGDPVR